MNKIFKSIGPKISVASNNADLINSLAQLDPAITATPETDSYKAEVDLVGAADAQLKYASLLQALKVSFHELAATLKKSGSNACGGACDAIVKQLRTLEELGHQFKDKN